MWAWIRRLVKWLVVLVVLTPVLLAGYVVLLPLLIPFRYEHGHSYEKALAKWADAMKRRDAPQALYWAERAIHYSSPEEDPRPQGPRSRTAAYSHLAAAYELAGTYDKALALYRQHEGVAIPEYLVSTLAEARVFYKVGQKKQAFRAYCQFASAKKQAQPSRISLETTKEVIVGTFYPEQKPLAVFTSYNEFLDFMRRQWEELGRPEEYREPMEFLESIR